MPPPIDSAKPGVAATTPTQSVAAPSGWDASAGAYLLIPASTPNEALVIDPERRGTVISTEAVDSTALTGRPVILYAANGDRIVARLTSPGARLTDDECAPPWPVMRLAAESTVGEWQIGLVGGAAGVIPLDSIAGLSAPDSAALAAAAARVASSLPVKDEAYFRGLPFAVHSLHRFSPAPGVQAFAASLVRRVNQEDSPLEERTFIVAERDGDQSPWRAAYHERSAGTEDEVESAESIAALSLGSSRTPTLVLVREVADGLAYRLLERSPSGQWRVKWTSAIGKCG